MATDRRLVSAEVLQQMRKPDELTSMQTRAFATMAVLASSALLFGADGTLARAPHDGVGRAAGRRLVFSDGFSGPAGTAPSSADWSFDTGGGGWGNNELECYTSNPGNASLDGQGHLAITAKRETYASRTASCAYTSARMKTQGTFSTTYGRIEARIRLPAGRGLWPAFWALGDDIESAGWPGSGEIDVMESLGDDPSTVYGSIHGPQAGQARGYGISSAYHAATSLADGFHTYRVSWSPSALVFSVDGQAYAKRTPAQLSGAQRWVFNKPFFLMLNLAVGGSWPGSPDAATRFPATMLVDWVRVYSR